MTTPIDEIPLKTESIVDLAWGLSLYFSKNEQERKYGEDLKRKWDDLAQRYKENKLALRYLDNVNAAMSATINNLAQLRQEVFEHFSFLDSLEKSRTLGYAIKTRWNSSCFNRNQDILCSQIEGIRKMFEREIQELLQSRGKYFLPAKLCSIFSPRTQHHKFS
jgi:hypothetical protein